MCCIFVGVLRGGSWSGSSFLTPGVSHCLMWFSLAGRLLFSTSFVFSVEVHLMNVVLSQRPAHRLAASPQGAPLHSGTLHSNLEVLWFKLKSLHLCCEISKCFDFFFFSCRTWEWDPSQTKQSKIPEEESFKVRSAGNNKAHTLVLVNFLKQKEVNAKQVFLKLSVSCWKFLFKSMVHHFKLSLCHSYSLTREKKNKTKCCTVSKEGSGGSISRLLWYRGINKFIQFI